MWNALTLLALTAPLPMPTFSSAPVDCSRPAAPALGDPDEDGEESCCDGLSLQAAGWSKSGKVFGYCTEDERLGELGCELRSRGNAVVLSETLGPMSDDSEMSGEDVMAAQEKLGKVIASKKLGCTEGKWLLAGDFELHQVESRQAEEDRRVRTLFLRPRGVADAKKWTVLATAAAPEGSGEDGQVSVGTMLDASGRYLGVLSWAHGGELGTHELRARVVDTHRVGARAYLKLAGREPKGGPAIDWLRKALHLDAKGHKAAYRLARALVSTAPDQAAEALRIARDRGGRSIEKLARKDAAFAEVRDAAWFVDALR